MPWETRFNELVKYKAKHGDCNVPGKQGQLGGWVRSQRFAYKAGSLAQDRIDRLSGIGFKWVLVERGPEVPWETRFDQLVQYNAKHGDCNVPDGQGKLGNWVRTQRGAYKAGSLLQDRIDRLDSIGFLWALVVKGPSVPWKTSFNELIKYKSKHGDCDVPVRQGKLGMWVSNQRQYYMADLLSQDRIDRLSGIGFKWSLKVKCPEVPWETRLTSSSSTRQSTATAMFRGNRDSLGSGFLRKDKAIERARYRRTASLA